MCTVAAHVSSAGCAVCAGDAEGVDASPGSSAGAAAVEEVAHALMEGSIGVETGGVETERVAEIAVAVLAVEVAELYAVYAVVDLNYSPSANTASPYSASHSHSLSPPSPYRRHPPPATPQAAAPAATRAG